jgi:biotin carboxylase
MTTSHHVVIVGGNDSSLPLAPLPGVRLSMIQTADKATDHQRTSVDDFIVVEALDVTTLTTEMARLHRAWPITAAVSFYEPVVLPTAIVADRLGVHSNPVAAVHTARNKALTRRALAAAGVPQLPWRECLRPADAVAFLRELDGAPVIVKPVTGGGSAGVRLVADAVGVLEAWAALADLPGWALLDNPDRIMLAEQVLPGREFSVEAMSRDGRHEIVAVTRKFTTGAPHYVEVGHVQPASVTDPERAAIEARVVSTLAAIGHEVGPTHTEVMLDGDDVWIVETHTRFGGDQIWELSQLTTGRHFATETIAALLDRPAPEPAGSVGGAAVRFLTGTATDPAKPVAESCGGATVLRVHRTAVVPSGPLTDYSRRAGYVLTVAESPTAALNAALYTARQLEEVTV